MSSRREFLTGATLAWAAVHAASRARAAEGHAHEAVGPQAAAPHFTLLTTEQARDIDAISSCIVPSEPGSPGAHEAGVVYFIDQALASFLSDAKPDVIGGLADLPAGFAAWPEARRTQHLSSIEKTPFFGTMQFLTVLGLLSDPRYGGNRDLVGWKLMGFEDSHAFAPPFGWYDRDYAGFELPGRQA